MFWEKTPVPAQGPANFSAWKDTKNADAVPNWALRAMRSFQGITGPVREDLLDKTLSALQEIVADPNVVPSTRYNAILTAGQLDSKESSPGNPPDAYPASLIYLVDVYQDTSFPPYLKYGALLGIVRHAYLGIDPPQQNRVIDLFLKTAVAEFDVEEMAPNPGFAAPIEPAILNWFRQTALDGLSALKTVGENGTVVTELLAVMSRQSQELVELYSGQDPFSQEEWQQVRQVVELASKVAKTLGDLNYKSEAGVDVKKMTDTFAALLKAVCDAEHKMAADSIGLRKGSADPAMLMEQIVIDMKVCIQSVAWGIQSGLITGKRGDDSMYAATVVAANETEVKRLDLLLQEINGLSAFFDEGNKTNRQTTSAENVGANTPRRTFKFDLSELRDALAKSAEAFSKI